MQTTLPSSSPSSLTNVTPLSPASQHFSELEKLASFKFAPHTNQCICPTLMKQIPPNNLLTAVAIPLPDDDDSDDMEQTSFPFPHCMRSSLQGLDPNPAQTHSTPSNGYHREGIDIKEPCIFLCRASLCRRNFPLSSSCQCLQAHRISSPVLASSLNSSPSCGLKTGVLAGCSMRY